MNKSNFIVKKVYIKGLLKACSSFLISTSDQVYDLAPLKDAEGRPFIPGSSIAGVLRDLFEDPIEFFGHINDTEKETRQSSLITYDCFLSDESIWKSSVRDNIKLKSNEKIVESGKLAQYEVVESGCIFDFMLELTIRQNDNEKVMLSYLNGIISSLKAGIRIGSKTRRGLGLFKLSSIEIKFIAGENAYEEYVNFNWKTSKFIKYEDWVVEEPNSLVKKHTCENLTLPVICQGTLIIRTYDDSLETDFEMVKTNGIPTIPASSWNGFFRSQARRILCDLGIVEKNCDPLLREIFGADLNDDSKKASNITFLDSILNVSDKNKNWMQTNVKIDRFTQGACDGALYTSRPAANFQTDLSLSLKNPKLWMWDLIRLIILDINDGYAALGGQTSIGRGILQIDLSKAKLQGSSNYEQLSAKIAEMVGA